MRFYKRLLLLTLVSIGSIGSSSVYSVSNFVKFNVVIDGSPITIEMVPITGGKFILGSNLKPDEQPLQEVEVGDFWMSTLEITWDQYELFLYREIDKIPNTEKGDVNIDIDGVTGATMPYVNFNRPGHPLVNITQYAASQYCKWLTAKTGQFYRLPTEAEWEYACRAGSLGDYSFENGNSIDEYAWHKGNSNGTFHKGGLKLPNNWGLFDMHGNVAEWVLDSYEPNHENIISQSSNPLFMEDELYPKVVRGGSWKDQVTELRSASRSFSRKQWKLRDPQFPKSLWWHTDATHVGFRIVRPKEIPDNTEMEKYWIKPIKEY